MNCLSIATGNGFFRLSPEDYKGLHQRYAATMQLAGESDSKPNDNEEKDEERTRLKTELASAFPLLMAWLWRQKDLKPEDLKTEQVQQFIRTHAAVLDHAVDTAIKETPLDEISVQRLKESNYVFSGIKTFHELKEAFPSLVGADGNIKPFEQFLAEVRRVHKTYNCQYLQAEYHLAQSSASMAARWKKFEKDGDRYLLQYRTIGDKRVRPTHRDLHGITLPINSKFWDEYFPPNNWNCRCSVVQVRRSKYTQSDEAEAMRLGLKATAGKYREMFLFNPGKTMTCFPMYNAYTRKACIGCKKKPGNLELAADIPDNELCRACKIIREIETERLRIKERRKEIQREASSLREIPLFNPDFNREIAITGKGIKEWLNQPHKHYVAKNEALLHIHDIMGKADYKGFIDDKHDSNIKAYIFETTISKDKSWIIVREFPDGQINLHSTTDSDELIRLINEKLLNSGSSVELQSTTCQKKVAFSIANV